MVNNQKSFKHPRKLHSNTSSSSASSSASSSTITEPTEQSKKITPRRSNCIKEKEMNKKQKTNEKEVLTISKSTVSIKKKNNNLLSKIILQILKTLNEITSLSDFSNPIHKFNFNYNSPNFLKDMFLKVIEKFKKSDKEINNEYKDFFINNDTQNIDFNLFLSNYKMLNEYMDLLFWYLSELQIDLVFLKDKIKYYYIPFISINDVIKYDDNEELNKFNINNENYNNLIWLSKWAYPYLNIGMIFLTVIKITLY